MEILVSKLQHWKLLLDFYSDVYRAGHPLQTEEFWRWQFGDPDKGVALIAVEKNKIVGHLGLSFTSGYAWHINLYIAKDFRKGTALLKLMNEAKKFGRQATLSANESAVKLYRSLKWFQYYNLIRLTRINPRFTGLPIKSILTSFDLDQNRPKPAGYFWEQPTLKSIQLEDGSTVIVQESVGGARFVDLKNQKLACEELWSLGFKWCDFVTSFNNPILLKLEASGWLPDSSNKIPWLLNPVVEDRYADLTFLSKDPIDINFYVNRTHADIGRVGSIT